MKSHICRSCCATLSCVALQSSAFLRTNDCTITCATGMPSRLSSNSRARRSTKSVNQWEVTSQSFSQLKTAVMLKMKKITLTKQEARAAMTVAHASQKISPRCWPLYVERDHADGPAVYTIVPGTQRYPRTSANTQIMSTSQATVPHPRMWRQTDRRS